MRSVVSDANQVESPSSEDVLKAIYESGLHQYASGVLRTEWKDGIDIKFPSSSLMNFVKKLHEANASRRREDEKSWRCSQ